MAITSVLDSLEVLDAAMALVTAINGKTEILKRLLERAESNCDHIGSRDLLFQLRMKITQMEDQTDAEVK